MAVRFDADGEQYTRSLNLGSVTNWTVTCWAKMAVNRAATTVLWQIDNGSGTSRLRANAWNGSALTFQSDTSAWFGLMGHTLAVGEWTFVGLSSTTNPGQVRVRVRVAGSSTWIGGTPAQADITVSAQTLRIGAGPNTEEWINGSLAAVKIWSAALTTDELELESWTNLPYRTANLTAWYPFLTASAVDYSGNGQTLVGGTGAATDDGPPISWSTGRHRRPIIGLSSASGSLAANLPSLTSTGTGTVEASGGLAGTLPSLAATSSGVIEASGTVTAALPAFTAALAGDAQSNTLNALLPPLSASFTGLAEVAGAVPGVLPPLSASLAGEVRIPPNDITITTTGAVRGWAAAAADDGWDSGTLTRGWAAGTPTT